MDSDQHIERRKDRAGFALESLGSVSHGDEKEEEKQCGRNQQHSVPHTNSAQPQSSINTGNTLSTILAAAEYLMWPTSISLTRILIQKQASASEPLLSFAIVEFTYGRDVSIPVSPLFGHSIKNRAKRAASNMAVCFRGVFSTSFYAL